MFFKGYALVNEALAMKPGAPLSYLPFPIAAALGSFKARYLFLSSCRKNLARIDALTDPKLWQFFRPVFFLFLIAMISLGMYLSRWAAGNYGALITVASLDLALSLALFGSLGGFKQESGARRKTVKRGRGNENLYRSGGVSGKIQFDV